MAFNSIGDVERRLASPERLTREEIAATIPWLAGALSERSIRRFEIEVSLQNVEAIHEFDRSSRSLTWVLIVLTVVLLGLTIVIVRYTVLLARAAH